MNFLTTGEVTLHYRLEGAAGAQPMVFVNSLGTDLRIWDDVVPHFRDRYAILRFDKRGHGLSDCPPPPYSLGAMAADLAGLLDGLNLSDIILVGISIGGMIAMEFAAAWPDRVSKLVLCDTAPVIGTADMWDQRIADLRRSGLSGLSPMILARWFAPAFADAAPAAYRGYANMLERMPLDGYIGACAAIRDAALTDAVATIQTPTLFLCGAEDAATPPDLVQAAAARLPGAGYREIAGAGHLPCVEQPDIMAASIAEFL